VRQVRTADDYRAAWDTVERVWAAAVARAEQLPEPVRHERVDDEWSFVETLRHLVFATDAWVARTVLDEERPYHPLALTQTSYPPDQARALGMEVDAQPSYHEALAARLDRMATVRRIVDGLTDADLDRTCTRNPAPGYPEQPYRVGRCLRVVFNEEVEHHRYAARDLAVLEERYG
jgi:uncharacterized damage-inducible protein DinB